MALVKCTVYALASSRDGEPRYVGQTRAALERRLSGHLKRARTRKNGWLWNWIRKTLKSGHQIQIFALQEEAFWNVAEQFWVKELIRRGHKLLNQTPGGDRMGGYRLTTGTKAKLRAVAKKQWADPMFRERVMAGHQRYWTSERRAEQARRARRQGSSLGQKLATSARMRTLYADPGARQRQEALLDRIRNDPKRLVHLKAALTTDAYRKLRSEQMKAIWAARKAVAA